MNAMAIQPHAADSTGGSSSGALPSPGGLNDMFLKLLVAQLQNQSPLNPMDPTQFVGQLAQFSELSEVTSIYQLLQQQASTAQPSSASVNRITTSSSVPENAPASMPTSTAAAAAQAAAQAFPNVTPFLTNSSEPKVQGVF